MPRPGQFQKGQPKTPGSGRKKGTPNKATAELKETFARILRDKKGLAMLRKQYQAGELPPQTLALMCHYVAGKPATEVHVEGDVAPLVIDLVTDRDGLQAVHDEPDED